MFLRFEILVNTAEIRLICIYNKNTTKFNSITHENKINTNIQKA